MPLAPPRPCNHPGCAALTHERWCPAHRRAAQQRIDQARGSSSERGYDRRWRKARLAYLRAHPLCREHQLRGEIVAASVVDHVIDHKGDPSLFWDQANWQPLCKPCHDAKTARTTFRG